MLLTGCITMPPPELTLMAFYNCENFYDTLNGPATADDDFTPSGSHRYTAAIYAKKLHNIATVVAAMGKPVILGLAEIENDVVLKDLVAQPEISALGYRYVYHPGHDHRGMNVALLYDPAQFRLLGSSALPVPLGQDGNTRDVLLVNGMLGAHSLHLLVNHWPSRRGGDSLGRERRAAAALVGRAAIRRITAKDPRACIIVMGDFNDNPTDSSVAHVLGAAPGRSVPLTGLYNPFAAMYSMGQGTEFYRHQWNLFDQIIVSGSLLQLRGLRYHHAAIYRPAFLAGKHKGHEGEPRRAYLGTRWMNGYSDHFPVMLWLQPAD